MTETKFTGTPRKATTHVNQNEGLIFEKSSPGKKAYRLAELDVPAIDPATLLGDQARTDLGVMPELSEIEIIRHFTRLSTWNYAIDLGMYPLGSCTMKYNPRVNEAVARLEGIADAHPYQPESLAQGCLGIMALLQSCLIEITGMDAITLQPAAGAHGEFTGILLARAYHESKGNARKKVLIPDSAHGTNPATAAVVGYQVANLKSNAQGMVDIAELTRMVDEDTAALMLTNPSTIGVFESEIHKIADILHAKGALLYMDGANMNALVGKTRPGDFGVDVMHLNLHKTFSTPHGGGGPGSGPVACKKILSPSCPRLCSSPAPTARSASTTTARNPSAACACSTATSACSCARWPTSWPTVPTACARPPKTRSSTLTTSARNSKAPSSFPSRPPPCTRSSSPTGSRRATASDRRHGQAPHRLRLPRLHRQLPHDRPRRDDD
jgi:glycine dehydrogenase subunit 2